MKEVFFIAILLSSTLAEFRVRDFYAGTVPHSSLNYYQFNVSVTETSYGVNCSATNNAYQHMDDVPNTDCAPGVSFNFTRTVDGGAELDVWWRFTGHGQYVGRYPIPPDQIELQGEGTSIKEVYTGPTGFIITDIHEGVPEDADR